MFCCSPEDSVLSMLKASVTSPYYTKKETKINMRQSSPRGAENKTWPRVSVCIAFSENLHN